MSESKRDAQSRRELLRLTILLEAYKRRADEVPTEYIQTRLRTFMGEPVCAEEVEAELQFLLDKGWLVMRYEELGATKKFRLHANGVLLVEREYAAHLEE